ncbi:MAG: methyltransferase domain-containing protein [Sedimentisphaerales bacterium]|nr:methyltransferase domain-containing protein [Sedimentisphaerales bacterium]
MKKTRKKASRKNVTKSWFRNWSNEYDNTLGKIGHHTDLLSMMAKHSTLKKDDKVLDIGCGTGLLSLKLLQKTDCLITGIDSSKEMMAIFLDKIKKLNLESKITCRIMDANDLDFEKDTFDKIVSSVTLHHIQNKTTLIKKIHKILKPGGVFVIGEIDMDTTGKHNDVNRLKRILEVLRTEWVCAMKNVGVEAFVRMYDNAKKHIFNDGEYCLSLKQWAAHCRKAGFDSVTVKKLPRYKEFGIVIARKK